MERNREHYRKLPGRRRGFIFGSSVWMGSDHLLLVTSARFRENYRRFYFRDIQAIVTADARRFHISTRSALIGFVWTWFLGFANLNADASAGVTWAANMGALLLVFVWAYQSARCSCRCRIYTAVSSEDLPSLYRTWTSRRFLEKVEPYVAQAQGVIEGNWAEAVEDQQIGPLPEGRIGLTMPGAPAPIGSPTASAGTARTPVSLLFVASLCLGSLAELLTLGVSANVGRWVLLGFLLLQLVAAVAVLVQNYMGKLRASLRNLAIVALAAIGLWYYGVQMGVGMAAAFQNASRSHGPRVLSAQVRPLAALEYPLVRGTAGGMCLLLGLAGIVLLLRGERTTEEKVSFNV